MVVRIATFDNLLNIHIMNSDTLIKKGASIKNYVSPHFTVIILEPQKVLCASETEIVGETEGEW